MEIHIDEWLNVTPQGARAHTTAIRGPQALDGSSPPKRVGLGFECPDCGLKTVVEIGIAYSHTC